jgi:hypothetical protein
MRGPRPLHEVPCSFCGTGVPCSCLTPRDHRLWCARCEEAYVLPSQRGREGRIEAPRGAAVDLSHQGHGSWFLADLALCREHLLPHSLVAICDVSVRTLLINPALRLRHLPHVSSAVGILERVPCWDVADLERAVHARTDLVWVSVSTQFGSPLGECVTRGAIPDGRLVAFAGISPPSGAYAGIGLYRVQGRTRGERVARFRAGVAQGSIAPEA